MNLSLLNLILCFLMSYSLDVAAATDQALDNSRPSLGSDKVTTAIPVAKKKLVPINPQKYGETTEAYKLRLQQEAANGAGGNTGTFNGPGLGGGSGDGKTQDDGSIALADGNQEMMLFHEKARIAKLQTDPRFEEVRRLEKLVSKIDMMRGFRMPEIFSKKNDYFFVDVIPAGLKVCETGMIYRFPGEEKTFRVGCTDGPETYIVEQAFVRMAPDEQLRLLYHEEMRRFNITESYIARLTVAVKLVAKILSQQIKGQFVPLEETDLSRIRDLYVILDRIGLYKSDWITSENFFEKYTLSMYGGWTNRKLEPSQKVGIFASYLQKQDRRTDEPPKEFSMIMSNVCSLDRECYLGENVEISALAVLNRSSTIRIKARAKITNTNIVIQNRHEYKNNNACRNDNLTVNENAQILDSTLSSCMTVGADSVIQGSALQTMNDDATEVEMVLGSRSRVIDSKIYIWPYTHQVNRIGSNVNLNNVQLNINTDGASSEKSFLISDGSSLKNWSLAWSQIERPTKAWTWASNTPRKILFGANPQIEFSLDEKPCDKVQRSLPDGEDIVLNTREDLLHLCRP